MPRNGSGTYTLPTGNPVVTGTTIESNWANTTLSDVATELTGSLARSGAGGMTGALRLTDGSQAVPALAFGNETGTGLYRAGTGEMWATVQGAQTLNLDANGVYVPADKTTTVDGAFVFNEAGANKDARFEGDTDANLLFTDASTDRVGVGTNTPTAKLNVEGSVIINDAGADVDVRIEGDTDANLLFVDASTDRVGVGTNTPGDKLEVNGRVTVKSASDVNLAFVLNNTASGGREWQFIGSATGGLDGGGTFNIRDNTAGSNRITLDGSGNFGLGVTPSAWGSGWKALQVGQAASLVSDAISTTRIYNNAYFDGTNVRYLNTSAASQYRQSGAQHDWWIAASGTAGNAITFTQAMTLDASGRLLVKATSNSGTNTKFVVGSGLSTNNATAVIATEDINVSGLLISNWTGATTANRVAIDFDNSGFGGYRIGVPGATNAFQIYDTVAATERARIDSSGNLLVGTTSSLGSQKLSLLGGSGSSSEVQTVATQVGSGTGYFISFKYGTSTYVGSISSAGSTTAYTTTSDYRLKESIEPMTGALAKVAALKPCTYKWKVDGSDGEGFIAHELQAVVPQCVTGEKDAVDEEGKPVYQGIDTSFLVATLTAAIQEQQSLITALTARIEALEAK